MAKYMMLNKDDKEEISTSLKNFSEMHVEVFKSKIRGWDSLPELEKLRALLNYKGNSIYEFTSKGKFTLRNIEKLREWVKVVFDSTPTIKDKTFLKDFQILLNKHENNIKNNNQDEASQPENHLTDYKTDALDYFSKKTFYLYEHFKEGLGRRKLVFGNIKKNGMLEALLYPTSDLYSLLEGYAYCSSTENFLHIEVSNRKSRSVNTNLMIRIEKSCEAIELAVGHMTFEDRDNSNVVTKVVIIEKSKGDTLEPKVFKFTDLINNNNEEIDESIIKFLFNREKNRLSSPSEKIITDVDSLKEWQSQMEKAYQSERIPEGIINNTYSLYYDVDPTATEIKINELTISLDKFSGEAQVTFIQKEDNNNEFKYRGIAHMNYVTKSLSVLLDGPYLKALKSEKEYIIDNKQIFMILYIPSNRPAINTFTGIITGVRDDDTGPVSRLVLVSKKGDSKNLTENVIKNFFQAYTGRSWVRPPRDTKIWDHKQFQEEKTMTEIIEEGEKTKNKLLFKNKRNMGT